MSFADRLQSATTEYGPACVGLDPHLDRLPGRPADGWSGRSCEEVAVAVEAFCFGAIDALQGRVGVVKPQAAFFEQLGGPGVSVLQRVVARAQEAGLLVLLDAKRGDIGSTAQAYARATLDPDGPMGADAVTLSPYLGPESLEPFVRASELNNRGLFVLVRTSNPGAGSWQDGHPVSQWVAKTNAERPNACVGAVVAANLPPAAVRACRVAMPRAWFLVPGCGAQGATVEDTRAHFRPDRSGALVSASRSILFADQPESDWQSGIAERAGRFVAQLSRI